jgi:hypothetical protein
MEEAIDTLVLPDEILYAKLLLIRGERVMLDGDLAELYEVPTKVLNQAVKRNLERFPDDFMFQLTEEEAENLYLRSQNPPLRPENPSNDENSQILRSQIVTSSWGGRRYLPLAFTEQGVAMLSSVLKSPRAVAVNIQIMRLFVRMRRLIISYEDLATRIGTMEVTQAEQGHHLHQIYEVLQRLLDPDAPKREPIGFRQGKMQEPSDDDQESSLEAASAQRSPSMAADMMPPA